jgi:Phi-29 DNA terminal protein GP3.
VVNKQPSIRMSSKDKKEYARLRKNSLSKVNRVKKNFGNELVMRVTDKTGETYAKSMLPENLISIPKLNEFKTRKEFNEWKQKASSFTNRANKTFQFDKNDYGVVGSQKLLNEIKHDNTKAQKMADKEIKKYLDLPTYSGGEKQVETVGESIKKMGKGHSKTGISRPSNFDFEKIRNKYDLIEKADNTRRKSEEDYYDVRMEQMKANFIEILKLTFHSDANELANNIEKIPAQDFYELYLSKEEFDFNLYDSEGQFGEESDLEQLKSYVQEYLDGDFNTDLKSFPNKTWG